VNCLCGAPTPPCVASVPHLCLRPSPCFALTLSRFKVELFSLSVDSVVILGPAMFWSNFSNSSIPYNYSQVELRGAFSAKLVFVGLTAVDQVLWTSTSSLGFKIGVLPSQNQPILSLQLGVEFRERLMLEAPSSLYVPQNYLLASALNPRVSSPFSFNFQQSKWTQFEFNLGEIYDFSVSIFNNNSQSFHENGRRITVDIVANLELMYSNGTKMLNGFCHDVTHYSPISLTLKAGSFEATSSMTEMVFCSEFIDSYLQISITGVVEGETRYFETFRISKLSATGRNPFKSLRLATKLPLEIESNVQKISQEIAVASDVSCANTAFVMTASLNCNFPTSFVINGTTYDMITTKVYRSCQWKVPDWIIDKTSQLCVILFSIEGFLPKIQTLSEVFNVIPGELFSIEESHAFDQSFASGDKVFNKLISDGGRCLEATLLDKQHNRVTNFVTSVILSARSNGTAYEMDGDLTSSISFDASVLWCNVTSTFQMLFVQPIFYCKYVSKKNFESRHIENMGKYHFNVTGTGASNSLQLASLEAMTTNGTMIIKANELPIIEIYYSDMFGNTKLFSSDIAIRIRFKKLNTSALNRRLLFNNEFDLDTKDLQRCTDATEMLVQPQPVFCMTEALVHVFGSIMSQCVLQAIQL
jgi:hypothetical protein